MAENANAVKEVSEKEKRIRAITKLYYSNPRVLDALVKFSANREVVPRYFEGFGKRPDCVQYPSDIMGLVNKGATSFHASEEIWSDPLKIDSDMSPEQLNEIRTSWDLLIDVDSKYLDYSKIATELIVKTLEEYGIKNYGIKFSGSKGFHIIVSGKAFPKEYGGKLMKDSFPEWPRAICGLITRKIKPEFNKIVGTADVEALQKSTKQSKEEILKGVCPSCGKNAQRGNIVKLQCPICGDSVERKDYVVTKRRLKCTNPRCAGIFEVVSTTDRYYCESCKIDDLSITSRINEDAEGHVVYSSYAKEQESKSTEFDRGISESHSGGLDLVLVAPRHLFRMPYSLHEKTALASVVISKEEIRGFAPRDANPLNVKIKNYLPDNYEDEGRNLLIAALEWKKESDEREEKEVNAKYGSVSGENYSPVNFEGVTEEMFPPAIKKLLKGVGDGKKRGLFILLTFLKTLQFSPEYINKKAREWNKLNEQPLKEGYIKAQIDWHLRQKKQILPPNYSNESFYKDIGLIDKMPEAKNPIVEVMRKMRKQNRQ